MEMGGTGMVADLLLQANEHALHLNGIGASAVSESPTEDRAGSVTSRRPSDDPVFGNVPFDGATECGRDSHFHAGGDCGGEGPRRVHDFPTCVDGFVRRYVEIGHAVIVRRRDGEVQFVNSGHDSAFRAFQVRSQREHREPGYFEAPRGRPRRHRPSAAASSEARKSRPQSHECQMPPARRSSGVSPRWAWPRYALQIRRAVPLRSPGCRSRWSSSGIARRSRNCRTPRTTPPREGLSSGIGRLTQVTCM